MPTNVFSGTLSRDDIAVHAVSLAYEPAGVWALARRVFAVWSCPP